MGRLRFRDRFFTPPVGRALLSPWSILLLGVVTAAAIMFGAPFGVAAALGVAAYGVRAMFAVPRDARNGTRIDPFVLKEPWRGYVQSAQSAKLRFERTVDGTRPGPLRDHLRTLSARLDDGIEESWRIASRGDDIDAAIGRLTTDQAQSELSQLRAQAEQQGGSTDLTSTIQSLEAQISSGQRMQQVSTSTRNRLRLLDARFDELVARAVEVSIGSGDSGVLGNDVNDLVTELEGLRLAIDDTRRADTGELPAAAPPTSGQPPSLRPFASQPADENPQTRPTQGSG